MLRMDPRLEEICSTYGVFLRREAVALGYSESAITRLVDSGEWCRVRRGAYVPRAIWLAANREARYVLFVKAAMRQACTGVIASHTSAAALHGSPIWGLPTNLAHLTRRDARTGRKEAGVQQHRGELIEGDVVTMGRLDVTSPTRAALEVTTVAPVEVSLCVVDHLLHRGLTTPELLRTRYESMVRWPGTLTTDLVLRLADGRSDSVGDSRSRYLCWRERLPTPVPQYEIHDENGVLVGRVDLAWPEHGVFLEFDGREKYLTYRRPGESVQDAVLREKRREELICAITGWRCIRIVWADLERPGVVAMRLRNLLFPGAGVA